MRKLNAEEVKLFASYLSFTESEAQDITDLFYHLKIDTIKSVIGTPLDNADDYIREWEDHWHRENNFTECYEYEKGNEYFEYAEEIRDEIFTSEENFKEYALDNFVYQLLHNNMVVVVC